MDDLVQFLRDRYDEDEAVARGTTMPLDWHQGPGDDPEWTSEEMVLMWPPEHHTPYEQDKHWRGLDANPAGLAAHIARHDPARVLREVEAKREIVDDCDGLLIGRHYEESGELARSVLRNAALPYADHPDYQDAWRP